MQIKNIVDLESNIVQTFSDDDYNNFVYGVVESDPILEKIHQFTFNPPIELDPSSYPVQFKVLELKKISSDDWQYFFKKYYMTQGLNKSCFKFFKYRFEVLASAIQFLTKYPDTTTPFETILKHTSFYRRTDYGNNKGIKKISIGVGKYWPIFWLEYWYFLKNKQVLKEECHINWLLRCPDYDELEKEFLEWEIYAIKMYESLKDFKEYENIIFGAESKIEYRIYNFFKGKKLHASKRKYLAFSLAKKYDPLLESKVQNAISKRLIEWLFDFAPRYVKKNDLTPDSKKYTAFISFERDKEAFKYLLYEEFKKEILAWAQNRKTEFPAQYFKKNLQGFITTLFRKKEHSTTEGDVYCYPDKIDDWYHCKYKSPKIDLDSSECEHRDGILCKHQEAKRVRIEERYAQMNTISSQGGLTKVQQEAEGRNTKEIFHDDLTTEETPCELKDILHSVAADKKDYEILFLLAEFGDRNYSEIGRCVGLSDNAVRKRIDKIGEKIQLNFPQLLERLGIKND